MLLLFNRLSPICLGRWKYSSLENIGRQRGLTGFVPGIENLSVGDSGVPKQGTSFLWRR